MKLLKDLRRLSFSRNRSTDSRVSESPLSESSNASPSSSTGTSPSSSLLAPPETESGDISSQSGFGPVVDNIRHDQTVIYQVVLLEGHVPSGPRSEGCLRIRHAHDMCPLTNWPVSQSRFKAMVYLQPGINKIMLEYSPAHSRSTFQSSHRITYQPMTSCPPLKLVLVHARDSSYARKDSEEDNDFESTPMLLAKARYRTSAYVWQTFIAESMSKHGHSRRTIQFENSWEESTLFSQDFSNSESRNQAPVHVLSLPKTNAELNAMSDYDFTLFIEVNLKKQFSSTSTSNQYFACLFLLPRPGANMAAPNPSRANIAYGGSGQTYKYINFALFGDQYLSSYPASLDELVTALSDSSSKGTSSEIAKSKCASLGMGGHLRQVGHMLGLPEQASGLMSDECKRLGYTFNLSQQSKEIALHPLDALRLRFHPALRAPWGHTAAAKTDSGLMIWGTADNTFQIGSRVGISAVEIYKAGDNVCRYWLDLLIKRGSPPRTHVELTINDITNAVMSASGNRRSSMLLKPVQGPFNLNVLTTDGVAHPIKDIESCLRKLQIQVEGIKRPVYTNLAIGKCQAPAESTRIIFPPTCRMLGITIFHAPGEAMHGIEFNFEGGVNLLIGARGREAHKKWPLNVVAGESIFGMEINVSKDEGKLCGVRVHTSIARISPWFGVAEGNIISYRLVAPETFRILGMQVDSFKGELCSLQFLLDR